MKRRFLLGIVGVLTLLTTVIATPTLALDSKGGMTVTHKEFNVGNNENTTVTQTKQIKKIREAKIEELNGAWTTHFDGRSNYWTYYLSDGSGYDGWLKDNGNWYYIMRGKMLTNTYIYGEYINTDGVWGEPPAVITYASGQSVTKEGVQATKDLLAKLTSEGWVYRFGGEEWFRDEAHIYAPPSKGGTPCNTVCVIKAGVGTVYLYTEAGYLDFNNYKKWTTGDGHLVDMPLEQYLEYKKQGKIGQSTCYTSTNGVGRYEEIFEYVKN